MVCNQRPGMIDGLLELGAARVARPFLRGGGGSDATSLPNQVSASIQDRAHTCSELILSGVLLDSIADVDWDYVRIETPPG